MRDFKHIALSVFCLLFLLPVTMTAQDEGEENSVKAKTQEVLERRYKGDYDPETASTGRLKRLAKKAYKLDDVYTTIDYLEVYMEQKPEDAKYAWMLAEAYRKARDYKNAEDWYDKIISLNKSKKYPKAHFYKALMQKQNGFYEDAPDLLSTFRKNYSGKDGSQFKRRVKSETEGAEIANRMINDSALKVVVRRLDNEINRETMESSPIIVDRDKLVYGAMVADVEEYYSLEGPDRPEKMLFVAQSKGPNKWEKVGELEGPFNKLGYHVPNGAYSVDGTRFYFTRCPKRISRKNKCAIYVSKFKDGEWREPELLNEVINDPKFNSTQPSVGIYMDKRSKQPQDILYFVSDREKTRGGYDIWYSEFDTRINDFRRVRNAGPKVNTAGDDVTPYYDSELNVLYFSSNGHPNLGGFDIYKANGSHKDKFQEPENIGYPLSSPADEVGFVKSKEGDMGFFVSNRLGSNSTINPTCCDDIYQFVFTEFIKIGVEGLVYELKDPEDQPNSANLLGEADVSLMILNNAGSDTVMLNQSFPESGQKFIFNLQHGQNYLLKVEKKYYKTRYIPVSTHDVTFSDTLTQNLGIKKLPPKEVYIPKVYFETNKANISKMQQEELLSTIVPLMQENPDLRVRIKGHSDDVGNSRYNVKLSERRAEAVYRFMTKNDIDEERFEVDALGESEPAVTPESMPNPDAARRKNRRVEFQVIDNPLFIFKEQQ